MLARLDPQSEAEKAAIQEAGIDLAQILDADTLVQGDDVFFAATGISGGTFLRGVELVTLSGLAGQGIDKLMQAVARAYDVWNTRISTGRLNRWLTGLIEHHPPPAVAGRRLKIRYITQAKTRPPMFVIFGSRPEAMPESYMRYLSNGLSETFEMPGTPIREHIVTNTNAAPTNKAALSINPVTPCMFFS